MDPIKIRATGVLLEDSTILLVRQRVDGDRSWSLPGGRVEPGESLEDACTREVKEETGIETTVVRLLYVAERPESAPPLLHITFRLRRIGGALRIPDESNDSNPITDVGFVPVEALTEHGFTSTFQRLVQADFPNAAAYVGHKTSIGL